MRPVTHTPQRWYGALILPKGLVQCVEARTVPRLEEKPFHVATDPVRASWPSR